MAEHGLRRNLSAAFTRARRAEKLATLALLFVLLTAATAGVTSVLIGPVWALLWESLLFGLLVGWVLAIFRRSAWLAALIVIGFGLVFTLLFASGLDAKVAAMLAELARVAGRVFTYHKGTSLDLSQLGDRLSGVFTSVGVVAQRVFDWTTALVAGLPAFDPVATRFVWSMLVWVVAAWAGWVVEARRNALLAALPAILVCLGTLSYGKHTSVTIYLILGVTLLLITAVQHDRREQEWDETGIAYPVWKGRQVGSAAALVAILLILLSALLSSFSFRRLTQWVYLNKGPSFQQNDGLAKSLGILPASTASPDVFAAVRHPGLPQELLIGSAPELSEHIVMSVVIENLSSISGAGQVMPFYWRSFTYDIYTGSGWRSSETGQSLYQANQPFQPDHAREHVLIRQIVRPVETSDGVIYADGEPVALNLPSQAAWRSSSDLFGLQASTFGPYEILSLVPVADESTLRLAGQIYPDWIRQRYLALSSEVPSRVKDLAIELTAAEPTPYDRVRAIERYLRTYPYTLDVSRPALARDVVDYFLFDLRKGYCDYYASAMVVLARAAGVPARLAVGYASGTYHLNSKRFIVTRADAHSWVEVYFPNIGWVPFEPTAARPLLNRSQPPSPEKSPTLGPSTPVPATGQTKSWWPFVVTGLAFALVAAAAWFLMDEIRLRHLSRPAAAAEVYRRLRHYGVSLAVRIIPGDTPYEFAASLNSRLQELTQHRIASAFGVNLIRETHSIINEIVHSSYCPSRPKAGLDSPVVHQWRSLRWRLCMVWIWSVKPRMSPLK